MLAAVQADYPPTSLTAVLAEALAGVLHTCERERRHARRSIALHALDEAIGPPLRAHLDPWTSPQPTTGGGGRA
jgi:hypothetical protein